MPYRILKLSFSNCRRIWRSSLLLLDRSLLFAAALVMQGRFAVICKVQSKIFLFLCCCISSPPNIYVVSGSSCHFLGACSYTSPRWSEGTRFFKSSWILLYFLLSYPSGLCSTAWCPICKQFGLRWKANETMSERSLTYSTEDGRLILEGRYSTHLPSLI